MRSPAKTILSLILLQVAAGRLMATELPTHNDLASVISGVATVVEARVFSTRAETHPHGPNFIEMTVRRVLESNAVDRVNEYTCRYDEFAAPDLSDQGLFISYSNYTGTGDEFRAISMDTVLLLLVLPTFPCDL